MFYRIHLSLCKLIHGELSEDYFFLVQAYRKKYPNLNVMLKKCFITEPVLRFENIIERNKSFPVFKTPIPIQFDKIEFGASQQRITLEKGRVSCLNFLQLGDDVIKAVGYREKILDASALLLFFLAKEQFFFGEYFFHGNYQTVTNQLATAIFKKYHIDNREVMRHFYLEDAIGSVLCFHDDGFSLSIKYFNAAYCPLHMQLKAVFRPNEIAHHAIPAESMADLLNSRL
jgi:hypothetical protein